MILEAMESMSEIESKLTAVLVRETYGRQSDDTRLTWDMMQELTGMSRASVGRAMDMVEQRGFFFRGRKSTWTATLPNSSMAANSSRGELNDGSNSSSGEPNGSSNSSRGELDDSSRGEPSSIKEKKAPKGAKKKKARASRPTPPDHPVWELPEPLKTADFEAAWIDFFKHRLENGRYLTQTSGNVLLAWLADIGSERAVAAIRHSIGRGWINIYEPDAPARASPNGNGTAVPQQTRDEIIAEALADFGDW